MATEKIKKIVKLLRVSNGGLFLWEPKRKPKVTWLSRHNSSIKSCLPLAFLKYAWSLAFSFSSAQLCDQSIGPKRLPPRLIRHLELRVGGWAESDDGICRSIWISRQLRLGFGGLYLTLFHPRMTHLSLDSLILISLFSFCACLSLFDSLCLVEFGRGSCSCWNPTGRDKSKEPILAVL